MKEASILAILRFLTTSSSSQNIFPSNGNVEIETASPAKIFDIVGGGVNPQNTTYADQNSIIFKNGSLFISNFNYGDNGAVITGGSNVFIGGNSGNFAMGGTATTNYEASYNTSVVTI